MKLSTFTLADRDKLADMVRQYQVARNTGCRAFARRDEEDLYCILLAPLDGEEHVSGKLAHKSAGFEWLADYPYPSDPPLGPLMVRELRATVTPDAQGKGGAA